MKSGIIYNGPSLLDGKPIVVIATYSKRNAKTGEVVQTYILVDGINPLDASKTGADFSICGDCAMRGEVTTDPTRKQAKNRRCYVNLGQGVLIVYKSFLRGVYAIADNIAARKSIGRKRFVRVGTYGDPAAVPPAVWEEFFQKLTLLPRTVINRDGGLTLQCNRQTITRKLLNTGKQGGALFGWFRIYLN
jgi:hypothetical protein